MPREPRAPALAPDERFDVGRVYVDVESSGLGEGTFPVEIAVSDDALHVRSWIVRPAPGWVPRDWQRVEAIHGLSWEEVLDGTSVEIVAQELADAIGDRIAVSDAVNYDGEWIYELYRSAGRLVPFRIADYLEQHLEAVDAGRLSMDSIMSRMEEAGELCRSHFPHTHVAADDARALAAYQRMLHDDAFLERVRAL